MRFWKTCATIAFVLLPVCALADDEPEPIETDRPDFTETARTVPFRRIQLEGGYTFSRMGDEKAHSLGELLLRIATGRRTEARIALNSYTWLHSAGGIAAGLEDVTLGMKVELARAGERPCLLRPDAALILETDVPTGSSAFRENNLQPGAKLCLAWDLAERLGIGSNINYVWASEGGRRFSQWAGTLSLAYDLSDRVGAYLEYFTFLPGSRGGPSANYLDSGITYLVNNDFQLDARAGMGLNSAKPDYFVGIGAARRW
jgi:hypothetical protein